MRGPGPRPFSDVPSVDGDPHFIIHVPEKDDAICFNIDEDPGTVLRLIQDPVTGGGCGRASGSSWEGLDTPRVGIWTGSSLPLRHPSSYEDYMLDGALQDHRLTEPPRASVFGRWLELRAAWP